MLVAMIREGEGQGACSVALGELWKVVEEQIERQGVVIIELNRNSATWRKASMKPVVRENRLKYIDAEGMRVITNNRCVAGKIKFDESENTVMDDLKIGEFGRIERKSNFKSIEMDESRVRKYEWQHNL